MTREQDRVIAAVKKESRRRQIARIRKGVAVIAAATFIGSFTAFAARPNSGASSGAASGGNSNKRTQPTSHADRAAARRAARSNVVVAHARSKSAQAPAPVTTHTS